MAAGGEEGAPGGPRREAGAEPPSRRTNATYVSLMTIASALGFLKTVVFATVLGADELGYFGYVLLVVPFGVYLSNWGILNGLNAELPLSYGKGEDDPDRLAAGALTAVVATAVLSAVAYLAVVAALSFEDANVKTALLLAAGTTFLTTLSEFVLLVMRARRRLVPLSLTYLMRSSLAIVLGAGAGALWGYEGTILSELVALALVIAAASRLWVPDMLPRRPERSQVVGLVRVGFPLMISNLVFAASLTIDRIFVASTIPDQFGQYTFATVVVSGANAVAAMIRQAISPQLLFERGGGASLRAIRARLLRIGLRAFGAGVLGLLALLAAAELLDEGLLAEYAAGLHAMPILFIGGLATVLSIYGVVLIAARRFVLTMGATVLGVLVATVGGWIVATQSPSLTGFAWVFTASQVTSLAAIAATAEYVVRSTREDRDGGTS